MKPELAPWLFQPLMYTLFFAVYCLFHLVTYAPTFLQKLSSKGFFAGVLGALIVFQLLIITTITYEVGDITVTSGAGTYLLQKIDFYFIDQDHGSYPYFPFMIFPQAVFGLLRDTTSFTFSFYQKVCLLAALYFCGWVIYKNQPQTNSVAETRLVTVQFLTLPHVYGIVLFHGQTDIIVLAFFIASVLYLTPITFSTLVKSMVLYAVSIGVKTWSVVFLPLVVLHLKSTWKTVFYVVGTALVILTSVFVYTRIVDGSSIRTVLPAVLHAGGPSGIWGLTLILSALYPLPTQYYLIAFGILFLLCQLVILKKRVSVWDKCFLTVLSIYILIPQWGIQYLIWIVPFLYLAPVVTMPKRLIFVLLSTVYLFCLYFNIVTERVLFPPMITGSLGLLIWGYCVYWFVHLLNTRSLSRR